MHLLDSAGDLPRNLIGQNTEDEIVATRIPEDTSFFVSPEVKQFLQGMAKIAQDNPSYEHLQDFKDFFIDDTLEDFIKSLPLKNILYSGTKNHKNKYDRFMVIAK